ncbi:TIGR02281 family clan AA aspartic protease [Simiduia sp. 21SJ11W-1]|uniref:retropepsin-like aspartic protease family protein n=1 Tax=Simiduia sp. 21SJ11W-1 TaxID=2909669 RepID=UPI00209D8F60|nr:TIGR02281 family clan AA aspartic protease [Simiduia sp. 21SJ11W-1]UTA47519.1 TIGR02281 family clan AA aspartic protease [Simiduia sp. 21SJ11W-1]
MVRLWLVALFWLWVQPASALDIQAQGLLKGSAVLAIDGNTRILKEGQTSPEGVTLVEGTSKFARVRYRGQELKITLSRRISGSFAPPKKAEVRLARGRGGHYWAEGAINSRPMQMMVDTGATSVAMSEQHAKALGVRYTEGQRGQVSTASGRATSWQVMLESVGVGGVVVYQVPAVVLEGNFPEMVLLGNSFLQKVDMNQEQGVLVIRSRL